MKKIILAALLFFCLNATAQQTTDYLILGTYTNAGSYGMYVAKFNIGTGGLTTVDSVKASNPSFLTVSPNKKFAISGSLDCSIKLWNIGKKDGILLGKHDD
jgi:6-phosphogluconolactonase (cycloisomerase 2 family)